MFPGASHLRRNTRSRNSNCATPSARTRQGRYPGPRATVILSYFSWQRVPSGGSSERSTAARVRSSPGRPPEQLLPKIKYLPGRHSFSDCIRGSCSREAAERFILEGLGRDRGKAGSLLCRRRRYRHECLARRPGVPFVASSPTGPALGGDGALHPPEKLFRPGPASVSLGMPSVCHKGKHLRLVWCLCRFLVAAAARGSSLYSLLPEKGKKKNAHLMFAQRRQRMNWGMFREIKSFRLLLDRRLALCATFIRSVVSCSFVSCGKY